MWLASSENCFGWVRAGRFRTKNDGLGLVLSVGLRVFMMESRNKGWRRRLDQNGRFLVSMFCFLAAFVVFVMFLFLVFAMLVVMLLLLLLGIGHSFHANIFV
jgi:hypothetical protein